MCGEGMTDQLLPDWALAAHEEVAESMNARLLERMKNLQGEKNLQDFWSFWAQVRVMIPAALRQHPQICCEGRVRRSWRAFALRHGQDSHDRWTITEWNCAGECL